ncbi:transposase [Salinibacter ruber]|uniref:transposase n=1 Tax=Salinibacter ruber TaxID=146919 RepID=UPI000E5794BA
MGAEWKRVKPIIGRFQFVKHHPRELLNRMLHLVKSGLQWRMLPVGFPPWRAAHYHFRKWQRQNLFQKLTGRIRRAARVTEGRRPSPSAAIVSRPVGSNRPPRRSEPRP